MQLGRMFKRLAQLLGLLQRPLAPLAIDRLEDRQVRITGAYREFDVAESGKARSDAPQSARPVPRLR